MPVPADRSPMIEALRGATARQHRDIEALLQLDGESLQMPRYRSILAGFEIFLAHWEPQVLARLPPALHGWFRERSRHALLQRDLAVLRQACLPRREADPAHRLQLHTPAAAWGSMYVLEGSALGGQVIARRLQQRWGLDGDSGAAYFHGWDARTGPLWRDFRDRLEAQVPPDPPSRQQACAAAACTFEALARTFSTVLHARVAA
jgi:heme oxygenase